MRSSRGRVPGHLRQWRGGDRRLRVTAIRPATRPATLPLDASKLANLGSADSVAEFDLGGTRIGARRHPCDRSGKAVSPATVRSGPAPSGHEGHRSESAPTKGPVPGRPPGPGPSTTSARSTEEEP